MKISISQAAKTAGVCRKTLRRWEARGYLTPERTVGGHRRYDPIALRTFLKTGIYDAQSSEKRTGYAAVYARVSTGKQRKDLQTQIEFLSQKAEEQGYKPLIYKDIASGLNGSRKGLLKLNLMGTE